MNGPVSKTLGIPKKVVWGSHELTVFESQLGDFMKPVIHIGKPYLYYNIEYKLAHPQ